MDTGRNVSEKMQSSLDVLRTELELLRAQDIKLLKELMSIQDTIRYLSAPCNCISRRHRWASCRLVSYPENEARHSECGSPGLTRTRSTVIKRHQSDSNYWKTFHTDRINSNSSSEDPLGSLDELAIESDTDYEDSCIGSPSSTTDNTGFNWESTHIPSVPSDTMDDAYYEKVLKRNVRLWKSYKTSTTL